MKRTLKMSAAILAGAFLLTATLPAAAQQSQGNGSGPRTNSGRQLGPGDGTGNQGGGPKDGTGYGSPYKGGFSVNGVRGNGSGTCTGTGPQGSQGSSGRGSSNRRGGRG